jgi:hypothetical protein
MKHPYNYQSIYSVKNNYLFSTQYTISVHKIFNQTFVFDVKKISREKLLAEKGTWLFIVYIILYHIQYKKVIIRALKISVVLKYGWTLKRLLSFKNSRRTNVWYRNVTTSVIFTGFCKFFLRQNVLS